MGKWYQYKTMGEAEAEREAAVIRSLNKNFNSRRCTCGGEMPLVHAEYSATYGTAGTLGVGQVTFCCSNCKRILEILPKTAMVANFIIAIIASGILAFLFKVGGLQSWDNFGFWIAVGLSGSAAISSPRAALRAIKLRRTYPEIRQITVNV